MSGWDGESEPLGGAPARGKAKAPNAVADEILAANEIITDKTGTSYRYEAGPWRELAEITLKRMALAADGIRATSQRRRGEIVSYIQAKTHDPELVWSRVGVHEIGCRNGILDVRTFLLRDHHPDNYLERVLPHDWDAGATCPAWLDFLEDCFGDDSGGEIQALQWFFGYIALSHARYKKALMLQGPHDTGKSVVEKVATGLVGAENCCTLSVEDMDDPGRRAVIKGKALNSMTELPASAMIADSGFKTMVSTEDAILLDEKYKVPERYVPSAKHLIACNTLPQLSDRTEAVFRRLLLIPFRRIRAIADQDPNLPDALAAELPGILKWAAEGARELDKARGVWPEVPAARALMQRYRDDTNPVGAFLRECCIEAPDWAHSLRDLNESFNKLGYSGNKRTSTKEFAKLVRDHLGDWAIKDVKFRAPSGRRHTLKALVGYQLEAVNLPVGCFVPAVLACSDASEIEADDDPPRTPAEQLADEI